MIPADLLEILRCPQSGQALAAATPEMMARINGQISQPGSGGLRNLAGAMVSDALEAALVRSDGRVFYPVQSGIPVLLPDEAISLPTL